MADNADSLIPHLESGLTPQALAALRTLQNLCAERGVSLYLVGGAVRDLLRGAGHVDLDLAIEGDVAPLAQALAVATEGRAVLHARFDTASVRGDGFSLDLAHTRRETYDRPGALPTVEPASLHDDLARRDFSVNAMALRLSEPAGELIDPHGGRDDLQRRLVRVLHEQSFQDDATRILRTVRYATRLGFEIESSTLVWLQRDLPYLDTVSGARLRRELVLQLEEESAVDGALLDQRLSVLRAVHPALRLEEDVAERWQIAFIDHPHASRDELGLCVLLNPANESTAASVTQRLHLTGRLQHVLERFVRLQDVSAKLAASVGEPVIVVTLLDGVAPSAIQALAVRQAGAVAEACEAYLTRWRRVRPHLSGDDLLALGLTPGPRVGEALAMLRRARLEGRIATREDEIDLLGRELGLEKL